MSKVEPDRSAALLALDHADLSKVVRTAGRQGGSTAPADLAHELLADLLHDAAQHPVPGFDAGRCRHLARVLRGENLSKPDIAEATDTAVQLARIEGPHLWAWRFWAGKTASSDLRRWWARRLVEQWTSDQQRQHCTTA